MSNLIKFVSVLVILAFVKNSLTVEVQFKECLREEDVKLKKCVVSKVDIDPCPQAASKKPCELKKGKSASISFEFTPDFSANAATSQAYWQDVVDIPFGGMDTDACKYTECPIVANRVANYTYGLKLSKSFPNGNFDVKWRLQNENNDLCCFIAKIKLV